MPRCLLQINYQYFKDHEIKALWEWLQSSGSKLLPIGVYGPLPGKAYAVELDTDSLAGDAAHWKQQSAGEQHDRPPFVQLPRPFVVADRPLNIYLSPMQHLWWHISRRTTLRTDASVTQGPCTTLAWPRYSCRRRRPARTHASAAKADSEHIWNLAVLSCDCSVYLNKLATYVSERINVARARVSFPRSARCLDHLILDNCRL